MKTKQTHRKLDNLHYTRLEMQNYLKLEKLRTNEAQVLYSYRVRMANYGENFRGNRNAVLCSLCKTHLDCQKMCFENCPVLKKHINISGSYNQIFNTSVPREMVQTLLMIEKVRAENGDILSQNEANSTRKHASFLGASGDCNYHQNS